MSEATPQTPEAVPLLTPAEGVPPVVDTEEKFLSTLQS
jgi:hypothetical protein